MVFDYPKGLKPIQNRKLVVWVEDAVNGYVYVDPQVSVIDTHRLKLNVNGRYYDVYGGDSENIIPLVNGSGRYDLYLYRQARLGSNKYSCIGHVKFNAKLHREDAAFLHSNIMVDYDNFSPWADIAELVCGDLDPKEAFNKITQYIEDHIQYDYIKALRVGAGEHPDISGCWDKKTGTCQDIAALTVSMLRSCGIPSRLVIGKADGINHAWCVVDLDDDAKSVGDLVLYDPTSEITGKKVKSYKAERIY